MPAEKAEGTLQNWNVHCKPNWNNDNFCVTKGHMLPEIGSHDGLVTGASVCHGDPHLSKGCDSPVLKKNHQFGLTQLLGFAEASAAWVSNAGNAHRAVSSRIFGQRFQLLHPCITQAFCIGHDSGAAKCLVAQGQTRRPTWPVLPH